MKEGQEGRFETLRERRRRRAQALYEFETALHEEGYPDLVYDEGQDLFRFPEDGRFAFSRERARLEQLDRDKGELLNS
jgi:hypothetical protein